jgi:cytochrome c
LPVALAVLASAEVAAAADLAKGEAVYEDRCSLCHPADGPGQGPSLKGVVGRKAASVPGFAYTAALQRSGLTWTPEVLDRFLIAPGKLVPGAAMPMMVPDDNERRDLIAFLAAH